MDTTTLRTISVIMLVLMQVIIPLLLVYLIAIRKSKSKIDFLLKVLAAWSYMLYVYFAGQWSFIPYFLRYLFMGLLFIGTARAIIRLVSIEIFKKNNNFWNWTKRVVLFLIVLLFSFLNLEVVKGFKTKETSIEIKFPLKEGFIAHGGNSEIINYHQADTTAQHFALDISRLNRFGLRAKGFFPENLESYTIFKDTLYSPCECKVVDIRDGLENLPPGVKDTENITGNYIILEHKGHLIFFGHLLKNSLVPKIGDFVKIGEPMGQIGNSGHTSEPHLHMHAIKGTNPKEILTGKGVPIYFEGKFPTRNNIVKNKTLPNKELR